MINNSIVEIIGNTPLLRLNNIEKEYNTHGNIYAKLEFLNPTGSVKDRAAYYMLNNALINGKIDKETVIIEPTSGNTGIGLAAICASLGMKIILTMPSTMSKERIAMLSALGAQIVLTDGNLGMTGAIEKAKVLNSEIPNSFIPSQFDNFDNILSHIETTGPEIYKQIDGKVDILVSAFGSGGTLSGIATCLKEKKADIKVIGVEPAGSPFISQGKAGPHKIQGIGAGFKPDNLLLDKIDVIEMVSDDDTYEYARAIVKREGLLVGISSGAALAIAVKEAMKEENVDKNIVVIFPDSAQRYLSTDLFQ